MSWIESHQGLERNLKMLKMAEDLKWEIDKTIGFLHRFWWWVLEQAEDGNLLKFTKGNLAVALRVDSSVIEALFNNHWIDDDMKVHDWWNYTQHYLKMRYHTSNPKRIDDIRRLYFRKPKGNLKEPHRTIPHHTIPTVPTIPKEHINKFVKPSVLDIEEYAKSINFNTLQAKDFFDYYEARGWKYKGNVAMKDWKSAIRLWKRNENKPNPKLTNYIAPQEEGKYDRFENK